MLRYVVGLLTNALFVSSVNMGCSVECYDDQSSEWQGCGSKRPCLTSRTMLRVGRSGVRTPVRARYLSRLQNVQIGFGAHPASY